MMLAVDGVILDRSLAVFVETVTQCMKRLANYFYHYMYGLLKLKTENNRSMNNPAVVITDWIVAEFWGGGEFHSGCNTRSVTFVW
jgi:hypothetical protein